jgi:hypothetical protein
MARHLRKVVPHKGEEYCLYYKTMTATKEHTSDTKPAKKVMKSLSALSVLDKWAMH